MSKDIAVLIVEENLTESEHLKHILEQHDYRVSVEHSGKLTLDVVRANPPQIVITDVLLPEMDGYELCREIKADEQLKHIPVILLTSLSDAADIIRGMECGADNFVTKPYDEELLISRLEYILLNHELRAGGGAEVGVEVIFKGEKYSITPERQQMVDLLLSTYETAVQKNIELERVQIELNRLNHSLEEKVAERTAQLTKEITTRQTAEASLKEQKEFLSDVIDANPNPIFVKDLEGRFTLVNKAMATLYGTTTTAIIGKTDRDMNGKQAEVERILLLDKQVIETAQLIHIPEEEFTDQKTGEVSWFQTTRIPIVQEDGKAHRVLGVATDITERKRDEKAVRESEKKYRSLFNSSRDGYGNFDLEGKCLEANPAYLEMLGYSLEEIQSKTYQDITPARWADFEKEIFENQILARGYSDEYEKEYIRKDGTIFPVSIRAWCIDDEAGNPIGMSGSARDITERKLAEEKLKAREAQLTEAQRIARVGSWTFDLHPRAVSWSDEMFRVMGYGLNEIIPTYDVYLNLIHPDDRDFVIAAHKRMMRGRSGFRYEHRLLFADGTIRFIEANATAVVNQKGKIVSVTGTVQDITERKLAEEKFKESEQLLRAIFDASRDGIVIEDGAELAYINDSYAKLLGYDETEKLIGKSISALLPPDEAERMSEYGRRRLRGEEVPSVYEFKGKRKDGTLIEVEGAVSISVIGGKPYIMTVVRDIAERKKAESEIRISEQRYRELVEMLPIAVYTCELSGAIESYNKSAVALWGREPKRMDIADSFCGSYKIYSIDGVYLPHAECPMAQVLRTGKPITNEEIVVERPDGTRRTAVVNVLPRRDEQGKMTGAINCLVDITDRKQAEDALRRSEAGLAAAQRIAHLGSWELDILDLEDASKNPLHCSDEVYRIFGYEPRQIKVTGEVFYSFVHPDERTRISEALFEAVEQTKELNIEFPIVLPDGRKRVLHGQAEVVYEEKSTKPLKFIGTVQDITERKQAEKALLDSEERLQQSQKMEAIGTLTGGVAHDFNNLLTAILGNTQLAQRKLPPGDPIRLRLTEVADAGNRAAELTRKLLAFSRRQHLERRTINLNDTVGEIVMLLERIIGEDVEVSVKYASDLLAVFADEGQIEQVVMNLAVNARDAMPAGGRLTIETSRVELDESYCRQYPYVVPGKYVQIRVSDSGVGMDEETQARIFEPYFTTKEIGKGTGLGLSMAYGIVKQHDGHINVYSELGLGTTFKIYLPADKKTVEENTRAIPFSFLGGSETILVAEDEESLRNLAKDTLEDLGYTVLLAKNGEEAIEIFASNGGRIDLFLSDVVMPRMGGSEAYERIREMDGGNIPLIFMTGYSSETVQSRFVKPKTTAEELGAAVIQKPYSLEELGRIVREVLDKSHKP